MITDIHAHLAYHKIYASAFLEGVAGSIPASASRAWVRRILENTLQDEQGDKLIQQMREAGITRTVLLIADYGYALGEAECTIDEIHALHARVLRKYPANLSVFAGVDPRRGEAGVRLFERSVVNYGFSGLKLYPPCGFELDDPDLFPLYEICQHYHLPVLTHTGPSLELLRTERRFPESILAVSRRYPGVDFILAHGGARDVERTVELALARENIFFDIAAFQMSMADMGEFRARFRMFFDRVPTKVLFGSDWPLYSLQGPQRRWVECFKTLGALDDLELERLLFRNAEAVLAKSRVPIPSDRNEPPNTGPAVCATQDRRSSGLI